MDLSQLPFDIQLIILDKYKTMTRDIHKNKRMLLEDLICRFKDHWEHYEDLMYLEDQDDREDSYINSLRSLPEPDDLEDNDAWNKYLNTYTKIPCVDDWFWNHWHKPTSILVDAMKF